MNVDDPRLTAYALGELSEDERAEIEKLIEGSPEARHFVNETQDLATMLKAEYAADSGDEASKPANLIDIQDDPWFASVGRPLAIAAVIAMLALVGAIMFGPRSLRNAWTAKPTHQSDVVDLENYESEAGPIAEPDPIPNPLSTDNVARAERVVIGLLPENADATGNEIQVIEVIADPARVSRLKNRLGTRTLWKTSGPSSEAGVYHLIFLDRTNSVVAAASFRNVSGSGYVLQPSKHARADRGRYFIGNDTPNVPGDWKSNINYSDYVIPFPDWSECIGYSPGA